MLASQLSDAGLRVQFSSPSEQRGVGQDIVHVLIRVESDVEAGIIGGVALAAAQRVIRAFKDRHPGADVDADQQQDE
jgi:hypothetical protein